MLFLLDMPDHFPGDLFMRDRAKIAAVHAITEPSPHIELMPTFQDSSDAFDQGPVSRLRKGDHIANIDFPTWKWYTKGYNIITLIKIWGKAVPPNLE